MFLERSDLGRNVLFNGYANRLWYGGPVKARQMRSIDDEAAVTSTAASRSDEVRRHILEIVESRAFKRSRRSSEFLQHLADKTLAGELDELKERVIGVQLFGRNPSYDTGEDAIVRVTATDVRRRLRRFYDGVETDIRVELPAGSYVIELIEQANAPEAMETAPAPEPEETHEAQVQKPRNWRVILSIAAVLLFVALSLCGYHYRALAAKSDRLPWSAMASHGGELKIVFSDPDIAALQKITGTKISLSDYAGNHYVSAQQLFDRPAGVVERLFKGYNVPSIDADFALGVKSILPSSAITTYRARALQSGDFKTEDNFLLLGSPLSNPWVELYQERLDFYFQYD